MLPNPEIAAQHCRAGAIPHRVDGARNPRAASSWVKIKKVNGANRPLLRQLVTRCGEQPLGDTDAAIRAALEVPPSASITSHEVSKSLSCEAFRIMMSTKSIKVSFIKQVSPVSLWRHPSDFGTMQVMVSKEESPESTQSVARRLRLTRQAF